MDLSGLKDAAASREKRRSEAGAPQDIVDWDLNTRPLSDRLTPFVFEMAHEKVRLEISQPMGALNEPGVPESGTGSALWTAAIGLARYLEHRFRSSNDDGSSGGGSSIGGSSIGVSITLCAPK